MTQPVDMLVRDVRINGALTMDARMVVTEVGDAALIARPDGATMAISVMVAVVVTNDADGWLSVTDGLNTWEVRRDTRCGSCGGRYELSTLDPAPFLPERDPAS